MRRKTLAAAALVIAATATECVADCRFVRGLNYAEDKKSANLYLFGSALFGVSTKPLYILDVKLEPAWECSDDRFLRLRTTLASNVGAEAPVDRSEIDPDSITSGLFYDGTKQLNGGWNLFWELGGWGEFTRKHSASSALVGVRTTFVHRPVPVLGGFFVMYPGMGFEGGSTLNRPATLFKRAVDFAEYKEIARPLGSLHTAYRLLADRTATQVFRLVIEADYTGRLPLTREPSVRAQYVPDNKGEVSRQKVTILRRGARHDVQAAITWNVGEFVGLRTQYRFGSLPPLFEFVDHQVTIGITFKASY
jgi:hypothetical protein